MRIFTAISLGFLALAFGEIGGRCDSFLDDPDDLLLVTAVVNPNPPPLPTDAQDRQDEYYTLKSRDAHLRIWIGMATDGEPNNRMEVSLGWHNILRTHAIKINDDTIKFIADLEVDGKHTQFEYEKQYPFPVAFRYYQQSGVFSLPRLRKIVQLDFMGPYKANLDKSSLLSNGFFSTSFKFQPDGHAFLEVNHQQYNDPDFKGVQLQMGIASNRNDI